MRRGRFSATATWLACVAVAVVLWGSDGWPGENAVSNQGSAGATLRSFELRDQYDHLHRLTFPRTNGSVFIVADWKGSEQIDPWIAELKGRYTNRLELAGIADVRRAPGVLRPLVKKKFREAHRRPVLMDWTGAITARLGCREGRANLFLVDSNGRIMACVSGPVNPPALEGFLRQLDAFLAAPSPGEPSSDDRRPGLAE